ncbi:MAG: hypothetical protein AB7G37_06205 [Solirubrobacteraceae bacterium]
MIVRPSSRQLLERVREELRTTVAGAVTDSEVRAALEMIDSVLGSVSVRTEHEVAWIREEIAEIEAGARSVIEAGADADGRIDDALAALDGQRAPGDLLSDLHCEYNAAGEVLSRSIEAALPVGGELRREIEGILARRLEREVQIRGEYALAGR